MACVTHSPNEIIERYRTGPSGGEIRVIASCTCGWVSPDLYVPISESSEAKAEDAWVEHMRLLPDPGGDS